MTAIVQVHISYHFELVIIIVALRAMLEIKSESQHQSQYAPLWGTVELAKKIKLRIIILTILMRNYHFFHN